MVVAVPKETMPGENRVALAPDVVSKIIKAGFKVNIEKAAGLRAGFTDDKYSEAGADIIDNASALYSSGDIVLKVQRPSDNEINLMKKDSLLIAFMYPLHYPETVRECSEKGVNVISMDMIPRTTLAQKMDALSSQANLSGYKSVIICADHLGKIFPLMMTAAGTISPTPLIRCRRFMKSGQSTPKTVMKHSTGTARMLPGNSCIRLVIPKQG